MFEYCLCGRRIEQIAAVFEANGQSIGVLQHLEREIDFRSFGAKRIGFYLRLRQTQFRPTRIDQRDYRLYNRAFTRAALRPQFFDKFQERKVLIRVGVKSVTADARQQTAKRVISIERRSQHHGVDQAADKQLRLGNAAASDRKARQQVRHTGVAVHKSLKRRHEGHKK